MTTSEKFLKPREVTVCKQLAVSDSADSQRAVALLAVHEGETQVSAAEVSGLSIGQVRYIIKRFRELRLNALMADKAAAAPSPAPVKQEDTKAEVEQPKIAESKQEKPKKAKKKDKPKKADKDKKAKAKKSDDKKDKKSKKSKDKDKKKSKKKK
jgi:outer membrane biosynthesis protein TonB